MLVGEGGDELGGYPIYKKLSAINRIFKILPDFLLKFLSNFSTKLAKEIDIYVESKDYSIRRFVFGFSESEKKDMWKFKIPKTNSYQILKNLSDEITIKSKDKFYRKILNIEYKLRLSELILPRIDYPTMAASIEARAPFMDHQLIEYTSGLDFSLKMKKETKTLIRGIARSKLPNYILEQPKVGFGQLLRPFFFDVLPVWYKREILDIKAPIKKYIAEDYLHKLYIEKDYSYRMWLIYSLNRWLLLNDV